MTGLSAAVLLMFVTCASVLRRRRRRARWQAGETVSRDWLRDLRASERNEFEGVSHSGKFRR